MQLFFTKINSDLPAPKKNTPLFPMENERVRYQLTFQAFFFGLGTAPSSSPLLQRQEQCDVTGKVPFHLSIGHQFVDSFDSQVSAHGSQHGHIRIVLDGPPFVILHAFFPVHEGPSRARLGILNGIPQKILIEFIKTFDCSFRRFLADLFI